MKQIEEDFVRKMIEVVEDFSVAQEAIAQHLINTNRIFTSGYGLWVIKPKSGAKESHEVYKNSLGELVCDCQAYRLNQKCSHTLAVAIFNRRRI